MPKQRKAPAPMRSEVVALHFTDIVDKVRRIEHDWPFPLSVVPGIKGIVRNQRVTPKLKPVDRKDWESATF